MKMLKMHMLVYVDQFAAIQVIANSQEWILAKVMQHDENTGMYHLSDEDIESNKTFILLESQVVILGGLSTLNRGDTIYAVYLDTTSFLSSYSSGNDEKSSRGRIRLFWFISKMMGMNMGLHMQKLFQ